MTRLSEESRAVIVDAVERARREGTNEAGVEHLLTAVLAHRHGGRSSQRPRAGRVPATCWRRCGRAGAAAG